MNNYLRTEVRNIIYLLRKFLLLSFLPSFLLILSTSPLFFYLFFICLSSNFVQFLSLVLIVATHTTSNISSCQYPRKSVYSSTIIFLHFIPSCSVLPFLLLPCLALSRVYYRHALLLIPFTPRIGTYQPYNLIFIFPFVLCCALLYCRSYCTLRGYVCYCYGILWHS